MMTPLSLGTCAYIMTYVGIRMLSLLIVDMECTLRGCT